METKIKPLYDKVVIQPIKQETSKSGLYIPSNESEVNGIGTVIAVGSGYREDGKFVPLETKVGDKAIYSKYNATEVKVDGEKYMICTEKEILAIIEQGV